MKIVYDYVVIKGGPKKTTVFTPGTFFAESNLLIKNDHDTVNIESLET